MISGVERYEAGTLSCPVTTVLAMTLLYSSTKLICLEKAITSQSGTFPFLKQLRKHFLVLFNIKEPIIVFSNTLENISLCFTISHKTCVGMKMLTTSSLEIVEQRCSVGLMLWSLCAQPFMALMPLSYVLGMPGELKTQKH